MPLLSFRCLDDVDDEVRDRAALYLRVMKEPSLSETYVRDGWSFYNVFTWLATLILLKTESTFSLATLETQLVAYVKEPTASDIPFDVTSIPKISREQAQQESARKLTLLSSLSSSSSLIGIIDWLFRTQRSRIHAHPRTSKTTCSRCCYSYCSGSSVGVCTAIAGCSRVCCLWPCA